MNNSVKERAAETLASAVLVALLVTAIALGAMIQDRSESIQMADTLAQAAERSLVSAGTSVRITPIPIRASLPVRRFFSVSTREGGLVGAGAWVVIEGYGWNGELLVLTDEQGRLKSILPRIGASGIRSEDLARYLRQREQKTMGGLSASADSREFGFAVSRALDAATGLARTVLEEKK